MPQWAGIKKKRICSLQIEVEAGPLWVRLSAIAGTSPEISKNLMNLSSDLVLWKRGHRKQT